MYREQLEKSNPVIKLISKRSSGTNDGLPQKEGRTDE
jgi:hypothetical protein